MQNAPIRDVARRRVEVMRTATQLPCIAPRGEAFCSSVRYSSSTIVALSVANRRLCHTRELPATVSHRLNGHDRVKGVLSRTLGSNPGR
jgi:hypothetical protein